MFAGLRNSDLSFFKLLTSALYFFLMHLLHLVAFAEQSTSIIIPYSLLFPEAPRLTSLVLQTHRADYVLSDLDEAMQPIKERLTC